MVNLASARSHFTNVFTQLRAPENQRTATGK